MLLDDHPSRRSGRVRLSSHAGDRCCGPPPEPLETSTPLRKCVHRPDIDQLVQEKRACSPGSLEAGLIEGEAFNASLLRGLTRWRQSERGCLK